MPRIKERSNLTLEQRYSKASEGPEGGANKSLAKAAQAIGHRKGGRRAQQDAHQTEQIFTPAAEKATVNWILKLDDYGFCQGRVFFGGLVKHLAKDEK